MYSFKNLIFSDQPAFKYFLLGLIIALAPSARNLWNLDVKLNFQPELFTPDDNDTDFKNKEKTNKAWFESIPIPPIVVANSRTMPRGACGRQLQRYIEELRSGTLWATQMFDASVKYPYGILDGYTRHMGSFDQCYEINVRLNKKYDEYLRGKYCLVDYKYEENVAKLSQSTKLDLEFDLNSSAWEAVREKGDFRRVRRYLIQMGLCVPAVCTTEDVLESLRGPYNDFANDNDLTVIVNIDNYNCQTLGESPRFSRGAILFCTILLVMVVLVAIGTFYDRSGCKQPVCLVEELLISFSISQSLRSISRLEYTHRGLDTIHMFRFVGTCLVIFGHRGLQYYFNPVVNTHSFEKTFDIPIFIMFYNGPILVDGFFGIGGLLSSYKLLALLESTNDVDFLKLILIRYIRLTPAYAFMIFFVAYILPHLGSGPQWPEIILAQAENCATTWWANLLYINNYVAMNQICMFQSWYLAVDFQSYIVSLLLVHQFWKLPRKIGYTMLTVATLISVLIPFFITIFKRVQPLLIPFPYLTKLEMDPYFCNHYVKTHQRINAYLVGVIFGAIIFDYREASWYIPKKYSKGLFILLVLVVCYGSQGLGYQYLNPNSDPPLLVTALYASLHRAAYAVGICSIVLLITICEGLDSHHKFMTKKWAQPFARLTYSAFLSHGVIQAYQIATTRSPRTFGINNIIWDILPDIAFSFVAAIFMVILIECPFRKIEKVIFSRVSKILNNQKQEKDIQINV